MSGTTLSKLARLASRPLIAQRSLTAARSSLLQRSAFPIISQSSLTVSRPAHRLFSTTRLSYKGLSPDSENPQPKEAESNATKLQPAELTVEQYNDLSNVYMDALVAKLEELQESQEEVDVEYSAGVLTLNFPRNGTYVINKQPPNRQIWLSSPLSGPKRYDFVIVSEGQDAKEGTGAGDWIYLRDGSSLNDLLIKELNLDLDPDLGLS